MRIVFSVFFFKQKTAYEMRISDWSSDVCSSDLPAGVAALGVVELQQAVLVDGDDPQLVILVIVQRRRQPEAVGGLAAIADLVRDQLLGAEVVTGRLEQSRQLQLAVEPARRPHSSRDRGPEHVPVDRKSTRLNSSH